MPRRRTEYTLVQRVDTAVQAIIPLTRSRCVSLNSTGEAVFDLVDNWDALPLTLATGYASDSNRPAGTPSFIDVPTPIVASVSERQAADRVINDEIFRMILADTNNDYNLAASVNSGVVTLDITSTNQLESQHMVNEMWQLRGVNQVKNERGDDMAPTLAEKFTMTR